MSKKFIAILLCLSFILSFSTAAVSQDIQQSNQQNSILDHPFSWNDRLIMHALRTIHSAEKAYFHTYGAGNFGSLQELLRAELIDASLASGEKYGYRFTLREVDRVVAVGTMAFFEVKATPLLRRAKRLSFYMNDSCEIRGAYKLGLEATVNDPIIEACGVSLRSENERLSILSLRTIHGGQMTYQATYGAGEFGTFDQLHKANIFMDAAWIFASRGYVATMTVTPRSANSPAHFNIRIVPQEYGRTGIRSFYVDETGILRGADKQGLFADGNDPPIH